MTGHAWQDLTRTPRKLADRIGVDPYDVSLPMLREDAKEWRRPRQSRFWFRSPCWANTTVDFFIHLLLPSMVVERYPRLAAFLGRNSPRWAERPVTLLVQNNRGNGYGRRMTDIQGSGK